MTVVLNDDEIEALYMAQTNRHLSDEVERLDGLRKALSTIRGMCYAAAALGGFSSSPALMISAALVLFVSYWYEGLTQD